MKRLTPVLVLLLRSVCLHAEKNCDASQLRKYVLKGRSKAWVCEGNGIPFFDGAPWDRVSIHEPDLTSIFFKMFTPLKEAAGKDTLWTSKTASFAALVKDEGLKLSGQTLPRLLSKFIKPGMAVAIETLHRQGAMRAWQKSFWEHFDAPPGGIDLYAARVDGEEQVGSYGWHADEVDALIYVLQGRKRIRIAGYSVGSKVAIDKVLSAGSVIYVPAGRFHHALALQDDATTRDREPRLFNGIEGEWTVVLSIGLVPPNRDLCHARQVKLQEAFLDKGHIWSTAVPMPPGVSRKPIIFSDTAAVDEQGRNALQRHAGNGDLSFVKFLLNFAGAEVDKVTNGLEPPTSGASVGARNRTALALAICCAPAGGGGGGQAAEVAQLLLERGARVDVVEVDSTTGVARSAVQAAALRPDRVFAGWTWTKARQDL